MLIRESNVKIENNKVVLSCLILSVIYDWETKENSEYIKRYIEVLLDSYNLTTEKYEIHHIIPICLFKDENHKNRRQAKPLADAFEENKIKLSYTNHLIAHYYLWKIFNTYDFKHAIETLCYKKEIENITLDEIMMIGKIKEECKEKNQTEEELKEKKRLLDKEYNQTHKEEVSLKNKIKYEKNREQRILKARMYREENKDEILARGKRASYDLIKNEICTFNALQVRVKRYKEKYKGIKGKYCIIEPSISFEEFQKLDESTQQSLRNSVIKKLESIYPNLFNSQSTDSTIFDL